MHFFRWHVKRLVPFMHVQQVCIYNHIYIYIWVNYNDLTATSLESWLIRGIIPKWPNISG